MANADNPNGFEPKYIFGAGTASIPTLEMTLASNVSIARGDALIVSSGQLNIAAVTSAAIFGISAQSVTGAVGTEPTLSFYPALPNIVFAGQFDSLATAANIGSAYSLVGTTGIMELDSNDTDPGVFQVIGLEKGYTGANRALNAWGANARVEFIIKKSQFTGQA